MIRVVCNQCGEQEVCPSMLTDEYDARQSRDLTDAVTAEERNAEDGSYSERAK